jgi:exodeoxyribonuclease III
MLVPTVGGRGVHLILLNIQHGGGPRAARIADWVLSRSPDVVVLPEWRDGTKGELIKSDLEAQDFHVATTALTRPRSNGVLVASKSAFRSSPVTPNGSKSGALLLADISNWRLLAAYFPQLDAKRAFFDVCIDQSLRSANVPFLILGDLNTGKNGVDVEGNGAPFACADLFEALTTRAGLVDLWRLEHGDKQEWSWRSPVNGFRVDHAFANDEFTRQFSTIHCAYNHAPRVSGLTDHSALILVLRQSTLHQVGHSLQVRHED